MSYKFNPFTSNLDLVSTENIADGITAGQLPFWDGTTWTYAETTEMFWDDTNKRLGLGTATPGANLHIASSLSPTIRLESTGTNKNPALVLINDAQQWNWELRGTLSDSFILTDVTNSRFPIRIFPNTRSNTLATTNTGVGIGTITPASKFDVIGDTRLGDSSTNYMAVSATGDLTFAGTGKYIVADNSYVFVTDNDNDAGVFFNTASAIYEFRGTTAASNFSVGAETGKLTVSPKTKCDGWIVDETATLQTTNATITGIYTLSLEDENTYQIEADIVGVKSDGSARASYKLIGTFYRTGAGNATQQGATTVVHSIESDANWAATLTVSGTLAAVAVTGVAATTIEWGCTVKYINTSN